MKIRQGGARGNMNAWRGWRETKKAIPSIESSNLGILNPPSQDVPAVGTLRAAFPFYGLAWVSNTTPHLTYFNYHGERFSRSQ